MKLVRYRLGDESHHGIQRGQTIARIKGGFFGALEETGEQDWLDEVRLLAPVDPPNIICIGLNYRKHADETNAKYPSAPVIFIKSTNTLRGPGDDIVIPAIAPEAVDYEAELAIVVGRQMKNISEDNALDYVLGYTCANDVSQRNAQLKEDVQWARGKSFDTFCPIGPCIETEMDPDAADISLRLNGATMQSSNTSDMIFSCRQLLSYISRNMTLYPGSIISTGTPQGVGMARSPQVFLKPGDSCEVEIAGIGTLKNSVVAESV